ncbi:DUF5723 family protein [Flavobacterium sp.]|uniref:DUF5723 family protein n=1 Tax=Flavobacterium sp. TaxID=239 RepID=UPI003D1104AD
MKNKFLKLLFLASPILGFSQSYIGFNQDNYNGVHGLLANPANIVGSPFTTDINLVSFNALATNDFYSVKLSDILKGGYEFDKQANKLFNSNNNFALNADVMGPSFMFNIKPKHAIAAFTRARAFVNVVGINGELFDKYDTNFNATKDYAINAGDLNLAMNSWTEFGLSYAAIVLQNEKFLLKAGLNVKYLQGFANTYAYGKGLTFNYKADTVNPKSSYATASGEVVFGGTNDFKNVADDFKFDSTSRGFGFDLGASFEISKDQKVLQGVPNYTFKFGASITDIGSILYKKNTQKEYLFGNQKVFYDSLQNAGDLETTIKLFDANPVVASSTKALLPTAFHLSADWNFFRKFYLNFNGDFNMVDKKQLNQSSIANTYTITPRYESKWFSFYLPINYMEYRGTMVGTGLRLGPLVVGSGSLLTNFFSESKGADVYLGVKIPVYRGEKKVKEIKEEMPKIVEAKMVPDEVKVEIKDTDGDGLLDNVDQCPNEQGPKVNNGCPYKDEDKDGIVDPEDKCPTQAGPVENSGCPWPDTDGDSVLDKDDKCVNVIGTVKNNGCPEVTEAVVKKLNDYAKTILFDAGKDSFQQVTFPVLEAMAALLNEYPTAKFSIEGHTDGDGPAASNLTLSEARATAVMAYLVEKGIDVSRLRATGYGETKPIAPNNTKAGKALNRRVEVKLLP